MTLDLGIAVTPAAIQPDLAPVLARQAEELGLDLVVVDVPATDGGAGAGLDPWTVAVWIAARTEHIAIGVTASAGDAATPYPAMVAKAHESLDLLAGLRLVPVAPGWATDAPSAGREAIEGLSTGGLPVVVPVSSPEDVDRLATLRADPALEPGPRPRRSAAARSRRRSGIDYDAIPDSLVDAAVEPGDPAFGSVTSTYLRKGSPGLVLRPRAVSEVADALAFARHHRSLPLGLRSGGHGISGRSTNDGGLVIDVGGLNTIQVLDPDRRLVRIGPGATWKQVAAALDPYGWAIGSGDYGGVGVGGLATAGGIGYLSRRYGLTIDHVRAVELVLADGTQVRATADENADLFWAMRGAGANFGVATAFELEADEVGDLGWARLVLVSTDIEDALRRYGRLASTAPRDTTVFFVTGRPHQGQSVIQLYAIVDSDTPDVVAERLTPFTGIGRLVEPEVALTRYAEVMAQAADVGPDGHRGWGEPASRSAFVPALVDEFARDAAELLRGGRVDFFQLRAMGGAIGDVSADEAAFTHRSAAFQITAMGADQAELDAAWDSLAHHFDGLYLSFDTDLRPERVADAFPRPVLERLRALKRRYDPDNLFRDNFNVDPRLDTDTDDNDDDGGNGTPSNAGTGEEAA